jgi:hypothetical protein
MATRVPSVACRPSHTDPIPPLPMRLDTWYFPATRPLTGGWLEESGVGGTVCTWTLP